MSPAAVINTALSHFILPVNGCVNVPSRCSTIETANALRRCTFSGQIYCIIFGAVAQENASSPAVIFVPKNQLIAAWPQSNRKGDDDMWVEELSNGKFKYREVYEHPVTGKKCKVSVALDGNNKKSQKLAYELLAKKIQEKIEAVLKPVEKITLSDLVEAYRADQKINVRKSTYQRNFHACNTLMRILGKDSLVERLTAGYVKKQFLLSGEKAGKLNGYLRRYKALMRWGYKNDLILDIAYLDKLEAFNDTPHRVKIQDKYLEGSELKAVLADMGEKQWELLTRFLALSGLRFAEFCALDKKDVDFSLMQIHIRKGYDSVNKEITYTKNCFSERDVHIQPELAEVCREINAFTLRRRLRIGSKSKIFFISSGGGRINYYSYNKYFKAHTLKVTGKELTPHALRHTHASLLFEQGLSIDEVARRLGHGDSEITRAIYIHVTKKLEEKDAARLDGIQLIG